jgi:2,3,4,5-tetrahydropyridine-2,6-dicarboxylate N-succinyltransferase
MESARKTIEEAWGNRAALSPASAPKALQDAVELVIGALDAGKLRVG